MNTTKTRAFTVTFGANRVGRGKSTNVRITPKQALAENNSYVRVALLRAIKKLFGARAYWFPNNGIEGFGQVVEYGGRCITPTVRLDIEPHNV